MGYWWESQKKKHHQDDPRPTWVYNNKMDHGKIGWGDMDWIDLAQFKAPRSAIVITAMKLWVP
jgi:hypothetical protein